MVNENDLTRDLATPAVIVASLRSGGTFLAHALSNHPEIYCDRGEPLHHLSAWVQALKPNRRDLLGAILNQTGYKAAMCKLTYAQAFHRDIWPWLQVRRPRVIWLTRENTIRQAVSVLINRQARRGKLERPQHTFTQPKPVRLSLPPDQILHKAHELRQKDKWARERLGQMAKVLPLTYAQVTGGEGESVEWLATRTTTKVCEFLGVRRERMRCDLQRVNAYPLREMLSNWPAVEAAVQGSEFAGCLADEWIWPDD